MNEYTKLVMEARKKSLKLTLEQQKEIIGIYEGAIEGLADKARKAKRGSLTERWATDYLKQVETAKFDLQRQLNRSIRESIKQAGKNAVEPDLELFKRAQQAAGIDLGDHFTDMFSQVPNGVLASILRGNLYRDGKGLSERIWNHTNELGQDIDYIIKRAIVEKKSAYELAKDLEHFMKPEYARPWDWGKVYPQLRTKQIDYNAQRLARTSITHAHRESQYRSAENNPFVESIHWELSSEHYARQVSRWGPDECDDYAEQDDYGLGVGNFPIGKVPMSHPQCLCVTYPVVTKSLEQVADELKAWEQGNNPELDKFFGIRGKGEQDDIIKVGTKLENLVAAVEQMKGKDLSKRDELSRSLLDSLDLEGLEIDISNIPMWGGVEFAVKEDDTIAAKRYLLNSEDPRSINHRMKTVFHEAYHAKGHGLKTDFHKDKQAWLQIEETFAEVSAHFLYEKLGTGQEIAPSYPEKLVGVIPRLKRLDRFKDCSTYADFGRIVWEDRLAGAASEWRGLFDEIASVDYDWSEYAKGYMDYIENNQDELLDIMLDNMPEYRKYKKNMAGDLRDARKKIAEGEDLSYNEGVVLTNLMAIAMNRLGVK